MAMFRRRSFGYRQMGYLINLGDDRDSRNDLEPDIPPLLAEGA